MIVNSWYFCAADTWIPMSFFLVMLSTYIYIAHRRNLRMTKYKKQNKRILGENFPSVGGPLLQDMNFVFCS